MSDSFDAVIIGAGAAGLFCAGIAGQRGRRVLLIDHSPKVAEKIRISGGGRANFTNRDLDVRAPHRHFVGENPACVMLKHEDWPGLDKISALRRFEREGSMRPLSILCGNGGLFLDCELERGADGANTGYAFPDMLIDLVRLVKAGARDQAHDLFDAHLPLLRYEQQPGVGLAVRKYVLMRRGILTSDTQRSPASSMTSASIAETEYLLTRLSRLDKRAAL